MTTDYAGIREDDDGDDDDEGYNEEVEEKDFPVITDFFFSFLRRGEGGG